MLDLPAVDANNKPVPHLTGGANYRKLSIDDLGIGLESDLVCTKLVP